jgi:hypothetical protein
MQQVFCLPTAGCGLLFIINHLFMKLAHLIIAHHNPQMLERLVRRLKHTDADIFIQLDKKTDIVGFRYIEDNGYATFVSNRVNITPGCYSFVQATINGINEILKNGENYSHINLLSSQDYPLKPVVEIHNFLFANADKTFMHTFQIPGEWKEGLERLNRYSLCDLDLPLRSGLESITNTLLPKRKMPYQLTPYGRSQWFTITPQCAEYVINCLLQKPALKQFFKYTKGVDEIFFQTILMNSGLNKTIVNNNLRYIELDSLDQHAVLTRADAGKLTSSGKFFARKFDAGISNAILGYLDDIIFEEKGNLI